MCTKDQYTNLGQSRLGQESCDMQQSHAATYSHRASFDRNATSRPCLAYDAARFQILPDDWMGAPGLRHANREPPPRLSATAAHYQRQLVACAAGVSDTVSPIGLLKPVFRMATLMV